MVAKFAKYWLPVIIYAIFIFYLSSIGGQNIPLLFSYQDVVFHIIEYALFALLIQRALKAYNPVMSRPRRFLWIISLVIIYGISDEFHQSFVPDRNPSLLDVAYDGLGAFITNMFYR